MTSEARKLNVAEATSHLGVSRSTFTRWRRAGVVPDKSRWTREELDTIMPPKNKPRGKTPEKTPETPTTETPTPEAKTPETPTETKPTEAKPTEKPAGSFDKADPFKADLPEKRPKGGAKKPDATSEAKAKTIDEELWEDGGSKTIDEELS